MSNKSDGRGRVFVIITAMGWIVVLYFLIHKWAVTEQQDQHLGDTTASNNQILLRPKVAVSESQIQQQPPPAALTAATASSTTTKTISAELIQPPETSPVFEDSGYSSKNGIITERYKSKQIPSNKQNTKSQSHRHIPRSVEDYKRTTSWEQFVSLPSDPLQPAHNFTKPNRINLCKADIVENLNRRLGGADLDWCKWALSRDGGGVQVS